MSEEKEFDVEAFVEYHVGDCSCEHGHECQSCTMKRELKDELKKVNKELRTRVTETEAKVQIDCRDCREGDGSCDKMHMPSGTMKMFIVNLQKQCEELTQEAWHFKQASDNLESKLSTLLKASEGMAEHLEVYLDTLGHSTCDSACVEKAYRDEVALCLADFRAVKEKA